MSQKGKEFQIEDLHPITKTLLEKRGVTKEQEVYDFLFPSYKKHIGDPFDIHGVKQAVERIVEAIKNSEKIAVYSDYDCDGVPGGVLLRTFFDDIGYPVEMYIPHRHNEGYGVHLHAIDALKEKGVTLIITVDSGIANIDEVAYAKSIGVDFIVTDHHLPITQTSQTEADLADLKTKSRSSTTLQVSKQEKKSESKKATGSKLQATSSVYQVVPDAVAVINSKQDVCSYHDDMLCGCAVAWKLSCALLSRLRENADLADVEQTSQTNTNTYERVLEKVAALPEGYEKWYLDLVGISTIADMVPLVKENRALAHYGLKVLRKTKRHGLLHIFNEQRVKKEFLTEDDIAFTIAPRVNAASRMGDPIQAHLMLYERDREQAEQYARELEDLNTQRKSEVKDVVDSISFDHDSYKNDVVVVGNKEWGPGILGLIAQKIIDETKKPVFVWGMGEDVGGLLKGSCRSLGDVSVVDLMAHVGKVSHGGYFDNYGGHEGAGGFSLAEENLEKASSALQEALKHVEKKSLQEQTVEADISISLDDINDTTYEAVAILAPFGEGNRKPVFELSDARALTTKWFGKKNEHFEVMYGNANGKRVKAIQFFAPKDIEEKVNKKHSPLVHLEKSYFGGRVELRLRIVDVLG
jgi:single-stranded-DNA-specific exonuclease